MKQIKLFILLGIILLGIKSQAQIEFIGERIETPTMYYDSIVYKSTDTLVIKDRQFINFIAKNDTITHLVIIHSNELLEVIEESFSTMILTRDKYFFEYQEGLYCTYIIELEDSNYFGLYLGRIE